MKYAALALALLFGVSAPAATIAPGDIANGPTPMCWGAGPCITTPPPPNVDLLDNGGAPKWSQQNDYIAAFGPNSHLFVSGSGSIDEYDTSLTVVRTFPRPLGSTSAVTVAANGDVYALSPAGVLTIYSPAAAVKQTITLPFTTGSLIIPPSLDLAPDQCTLFYTDGAHAGQRYDVCAVQALPALSAGAWNAVRAMSDGGYVAASGSTLSVFDASNHLLRSMTLQVPTIIGLAFDVDPHFLLLGTTGGVVRLRLSDGMKTGDFGLSSLYLAVNGEQRASAAAILGPAELPALSPLMLLSLAAALTILAWLRLRA